MFTKRPDKYPYPTWRQHLLHAMNRMGMPWWAAIVLTLGSVGLAVFAIVSTRSCAKVMEAQEKYEAAQ